MQLITGSIVLYKSAPDYIEEIIKSFLPDPSLNRHLFLIDNSPTDALSSLASVAPEQQIKYYHSPRNVGFGSAHNIAIKQAIALGSQFHVIINPDVSFEPSIIEHLATFMEEQQRVGLVMPKVEYPDGSPQYLCKLLPRPLDVFVRRFIPFARIREKINERYELRELYDADRAVEVPCLSGCFMFVRTSVLAQIGGFDDRYFMYVEDVDLCRRIGQVSKTVCLPTLLIQHAFSKGSYRDAKLLKHHLWSMVLYFNKWGWICDKERREINQRCLKKIRK